MAQAAFDTYREQAFDIKIDRVEKRGSEIHVWEELYDDFQFFFDFPTTLITDMKDKQVILTFSSCSESVAYMHQLVGNHSKVSSPYELSIPAISRKKP